MRKFIKYRSIEKNGFQYDCYIAADIIRAVAPLYITDNKGENACVILTRDDQRIETDNSQEEIMAQLAPELVYGVDIRLSPQFINASAFLAALRNLSDVYAQAAAEADKTKTNIKRFFAMEKHSQLNKPLSWRDIGKTSRPRRNDAKN